MKIDEAVKLCRHHPNVAKIIIWSPRWHDRRVLIAPLKVKEHNIIAFTKSKSLDRMFYISSKNIRKYPKQTNGTILCYAVPLDDFKPFEWDEKCLHDT